MNLSQLSNVLSEQCVQQIDEILHELGIKLRRSGNVYIGRCFHSGADNPSSLNLYCSGNSHNAGWWVCNTRHCEKSGKYYNNLSGLLYFHFKQENPKAIFIDTLKWMATFLGYKNLGEVNSRNYDKGKQIYNQIVKKWTINNQTKPSKVWTKDQLANLLEIPSPYFIKRSFSKEVLSKYYIGYHRKSGRSLCPIFDEEGKYCVGFYGRSVYERCPTCQHYHDSLDKCPQNDYEISLAQKWRTSKDFHKSEYLFNLWWARQGIIDKSSIILVEGIGDVLRLVEAGINNAVAIMGVSLSDHQAFLVETSGALEAVLCLDNDEAGRLGASEIEKRFRRTHRIKKIILPSVTKDVGELKVDDVKKLFE